MGWQNAGGWQQNGWGLVVPAAPGGSIAFIAGAAAGSSDGGFSVTTAAINTSGSDLLVQGLAFYTPVVATVQSDSKSNTWTPLTAVNHGGGVVSGRIYFSKPSSVGSGHTFSAINGGYYGTVAAAFSGVHATPFDLEGTGGTGTSTTPSASSITPTQNSELIIALVATADGLISAINAGFTIIDAAVPASSGQCLGGAMAYKIQTTAAAIDPDWTNSLSTDWAAAIASFKAATP